jgi:hypothetical protein
MCYTGGGRGLVREAIGLDAPMDHERPLANRGPDGDDPAHLGGGAADDAPTLAPYAEEPEPLVRVRYGLGKELRLYPDEFVVAHLEVGEELRLRLDSVRRLILTPGDQVPSKLVLMFDLDDGTTIIAAEGMSNVRDFRRLLARLTELKPDLALDPPDMDEQLRQALDVRRRSNLGCYVVVFAACLIVWLVYMAVALIPHVAPHGVR